MLRAEIEQVKNICREIVKEEITRAMEDLELRIIYRLASTDPLAIIPAPGGHEARAKKQLPGTEAATPPRASKK